MRAALLAVLAAAVVSSPVLAQERPAALFPTRDVAVTYRTSNGHELRMSFLAEAQKMRVDMPQDQGWMVMDRREGRGFLVMHARRVVMQISPESAGGGTQALREPGANARFSRQGNATVAGIACTIWQVEDGGDASRTCLTEDGVMLRVANGRGTETRMEATSVAYGPQDATQFVAPPDYRVLQMPANLPGMAPRR